MLSSVAVNLHNLTAYDIPWPLRFGHDDEERLPNLIAAIACFDDVFQLHVRDANGQPCPACNATKAEVRRANKDLAGLVCVVDLLCQELSVLNCVFAFTTSYLCISIPGIQKEATRHTFKL